MSLTLPVITSAALIDSVNPCAISVLLLTIGFLLSLEKSRREILSIAGFYILGIFVTYILIGLGTLQALTFIGIPRAISTIGAFILLVTGIINLLGILIPRFPIRLVIPQFGKPGIARLLQQASLPSAVALGVMVGLFEFPCTGGPYLLILSLLHDSASFVSGALYLIYYNLIFVLPLVLILLISHSSFVLDKINFWRKTSSRNLEIGSSLAMIILALIILLL